MKNECRALVPLSPVYQAALKAVAETENRRQRGSRLAAYPYATAFFRCLNGSRRVSLDDLRLFSPALTADALRGSRSQWLNAVDMLIESHGE
ncbi:plasmid SOS inhibition protein A, partial [Salmonella enterica subsp. enterica]|nr:plasmid SOS inhibition protein A [Salmonella enterica subsp. enterica]